MKIPLRNSRGTSIRTLLGENGCNPIPQKFSGYLNLPENKSDLYTFAGRALVRQKIAGRDIVSSCGEDCLTNNGHVDLSFLQNCILNEADTRILLHLLHASTNGHRKAMVKNS